MMKEEEHPAMICPRIFNKSNEEIPAIRAPRLSGKEVDPLSFMPAAGPTANLYPFLGIGLYDRALFQRLRGYDESISGAYWQTLDFGTRCWLYGYPIYTMSDIAVLFFGKQFLIEDRTEVQGCERFYSKALAVRQIKGRNFIRKTSRMSSKVISEEVKPRLGLYKTDFHTLQCTTSINLLINFFGGESVDFIDGPYWAKMFVMCFYIIWVVLPFKVLLLTSALASVNSTYYNAARVDGTGSFRIFFKITLPMISPTIFYLVITGFIGAFKEYSDAVALFGTDLNAAGMNTIVGYVYDMLYGDSGGYPSFASAAAIILFVIVLTITCINLLVSKKHVYYT